MRWAIGRLTREQQQVIALKFGEELSNAEIAHILCKKEGAIKALQHRALTNLRKILTDQDQGRQPPGCRGKKPAPGSTPW